MTFSTEQSEVHKVQLFCNAKQAIAIRLFSLFRQRRQARDGGRNDWSGVVWTVSFIMIHLGVTATAPALAAPTTWSALLVTHP